ncbi:MAG: hypothetical protein ABEL04_12125 [Salinibacter sp.]|uniref:hypothetical protein n=1 Tax=Salinibacter sp. TaxID=2065818 RepID=UPI0035D4A633
MPESTPSGDAPSRSETARDVVIFQVKLWLEGFKDVVLMPLSLGAAVIDLVFGGSTLYAVMKLGDRFERWVHLYAPLEEPESKPEDPDPQSLDRLLNEAADGIENKAASSRPEETEASWSSS